MRKPIPDRQSRNSDKRRIAELRRLLDLTQHKFASAVGITQGALSQLERGRSQLSLDTIRKISDAFEVNCNWLIRGTGRIFLDGVEPSGEPAETITSVPGVGRESLVPLISQEAHAGYVDSCHDLEYISTLDVYRIPGYESGNYRLFEIEGDSMVPTIYPREIVIAELFEDWSALENGTLGIITTLDGIVAKRAFIDDSDRSTLILKSDNADYRTYSIEVSSVIEIRTVRAKITSVFAQEQLIDANRITSLESDIRELKSQVNAIAGSIVKQPAP
jgi:DNA-binding XRE family transcriptional regulator